MNKQYINKIQDLFKKLTLREKNLIILLLIIVSIFIIISIINFAIKIDLSVKTKYIQNQKHLLNSEMMKNQYKQLILVKKSRFNKVDLAQLDKDIIQVLRISEANAIIEDDFLTIKADNIVFDDAVLFLNKLRLDYGLFPIDLKIALVTPGYVNFSVVFYVADRH